MSNPPWIRRSFARLEALLTSLEAPLQARLSVILQRLSRTNGGRSLESALTSPAATPFLALLEAYRCDLGLEEGDPRLALIGEATLALYLYVRVQDDLVDEPHLFDPAYVYLAEVFAGRSLSAFAQALSGDAHFFTFREEVMRKFARVALWEVDIYRRGKEEGDGLALIGQKFLPMAVPLGALACAAGKWSDLPELMRFVTTLGTGLQVLNDVLNIEEDCAAGRLTPVLFWLYNSGAARPGQPPALVRAALLGSPVLKRAVAVARQKIQQAALLAEGLGASSLQKSARLRLDFADSVPRRLLALCLRMEAA